MAFKLSPEFSDGSSFIIVKTKEEAIGYIKSWMYIANEYPNEPATIEYIEMSDEEVDSLPEI